MIQCNEITQTVNELAPHMNSLDLYNSSVAGGSSIETFEAGDPRKPMTYTTTSAGLGTPHNNMQPYVVRLRIMKL